MPGFVDFINALKKHEQGFVETDASVSPKNTIISYSYFNAIEDGISKLFDNIVNNLNSKDKIDRFIAEFIPSDLDSKGIEELFSSTCSMLKKEYKIEGYQSKIKRMVEEKKSIPDIIDEINKAILNTNSPKNNDGMNKIISKLASTLKASYYNKMKVPKDERIVGLISNLENKLRVVFPNENDLDSITPSKEVYTSCFTDDDIEIYPEDEKIKELKTLYPKETELLDKVNKLLSSIYTNEHKILGNVGEETGKTSNAILTKITLDECKKKGIPESNLNVSRSQITLKLGTQEFIDGMTKVSNTTGSIDPKQKQEIIEICKIIEKDIYNGNDKKHHEDAYYPIKKARMDLREAINKKNLKLIRERTKTLDRYQKIYTDLLKRCNKISDNSLILSNRTVARGGELPGFMSRDIIGNTRITSMFYLVYSSKNIGVTVEEMVNNPINALKTGTYHSIFSEDAPIQKHFVKDKGNVVNLIVTALDDRLKFDLSASLNNRVDFFANGILNLAILNNSETKNDLLGSFNLYKQNTYDQLNELLTGYAIFRTMETNTKEYIKNILVTNIEDMNMIKICPTLNKYVDPDTLMPFKKFDYNEYFKEKGKFSEIVSRMSDLNKGIKNRSLGIPPAANVAIDEIANEIINDPREKGELMTQALTKIRNNKSLKKTEIESIRAEERFNELNKDGIDKNNLSDTIKVYADLKKKYDNRSMFAKIFYSNVKIQSNLLDSMREKIVSSGFNKDELDKALTDYYANRLEEFDKRVNINSECLTNDDRTSHIEIDMEDELQIDEMVEEDSRDSIQPELDKEAIK